MEEILGNIMKLVADEQNRRLLLPFFDVEINYTIFSMAHNKSLGLDSFPTELF